MTTERCHRGWLRLSLCILMIATIWGGILPWVARWEPVKNHLQLLQENNIDAGVMFYSELEEGVVPDQDRIQEILSFPQQ